MLAVPSGGMGAHDSAGFLHQTVRPDGHQRVEAEQCRCRAQNGQVRPLPLRLNTQMFAYFLEGCLDPPAAHEALEDSGGFEVKVGAEKRLRSRWPDGSRTSTQRIAAGGMPL